MIRTSYLFLIVLGSTLTAVLAQTQRRPSTTDYSRLVRVWDIRAGAPDDNPYRRKRSPGDRMLMLTGDADLSLLSSQGFTVGETAIDPTVSLEVGPGIWETGILDSGRKLAKSAGMDWGFFGGFAFPARWSREREPFTRLTCLEHQHLMQAYSPWEPKLGNFAGRALQRLSQLYPDMAILTLGINGEHGWCGMPDGSGVATPQGVGSWEARFGDAHDHAGWWCGDALARQNFRDTMLRKYQDIDTLNSAWGTRYRSQDQIEYPQAIRVVSSVERRRWLDFVTWYRNGVTAMADTLCRAARRRFPDTPLLIPVGFPDENPRYSPEPSLLARIARRYNAQLRVVEPAGSSPVALQAGPAGHLSSACRLNSAPVWIDSGASSQSASMFSAASMGATGFAVRTESARANRDAIYRNSKYLRVENPIRDVAMFFPTTSHLLSGAGYPQTFLKGCSEVRDLLDYEIVDERMIQDGALESYRVLVLWEGTIVEADTLARIRDWVQNGGVIAAYDFGKIETVEGDRGWFNELFGHAGRLNPANVGMRFLPTGTMPARYRIPVGNPATAQFLSGDWYPAESDSGGTRRWTGASAEMYLPVEPGRAYSLSIRATVPTDGAGFRREVLVNGIKLGELDRAGDSIYRFRFLAPRSPGVSTLTIQSQTYQSGGRLLGAGITYVQLDPSPGASAPEVALPMPVGRLEPSIDLKRLRDEWAKPFGHGWTVYFPATRRRLNGFYEVVRYLTYHLSDLDSMKKDAIAIDNAWDGAIATLTEDKAFYFNAGTEIVSRSVVLSPGAFQARSDIRLPASFTHALSLEPGGISAIHFEGPPQELLLQCERFLDLHGNRPSPGGPFYPGTGASNVLIPTNGSLSTRFRCDTPGSYKVSYRAIRKGALARADILVDGTLLGSNSRQPHSQTLLAGTIDLTRGIHGLQIRPRPGEDIRADFVVLSNDPLVAGYSFAVK